MVKQIPMLVGDPTRSSATTLILLKLAHVDAPKLLGCTSGNRYRTGLSSKRKYAHDSPPAELLRGFLLRSAFAPAIPFRLHTHILELSMRSCPYCETGSIIATAVAEAV